MEDVLKQKRAKKAFKIPKWIWGKNEFEENHWIEIRKTFSIENIGECVVLNISVDTDYCAWLNGQFIGTGQFSDYPRDKHYDSLNIISALKKGTNILCLLAFYQGRSTSRYRKGKAGLIFWLDCKTVFIISDKFSKIRTSLTYFNGPTDLVTPQLGLVITNTANLDDNWMQANYDDSDWPDALEIGTQNDSFWGLLSPRPLPKLLIKDAVQANVIKTGGLIRKKSSGIIAEIMANDKLMPDVRHIPSMLDKERTESKFIIAPPQDSEDGVFLILDMGAEVFGYLEIELTCESGVVIDIAHGEHIFDGRVRCSIQGRNFADRYISKSGYQKWQMPIRRLGCRYIELHITNYAESLIIHYVGISPVAYPVIHRGRFRCSEEIYNRIYEVSKRTLELCMHEHYEDCPWREQALYAMDSRIQALCGYYAFGEYDFPEESLRLLGKGLRDDGFLELTAPAEVPITIPCFSMVWITEILQHYFYSGNRKLVDEFLPQMKYMLNSYMSDIDKTGLMPILSDPKYWNYYEWSPGLDGCVRTDEKTFHCCLNLFLLEAVDALGQICSLIGDRDAEHWYLKGHELRKNIKQVFFDSERKLFKNSTSGRDEQFSQLTQALALLQNICNPQQSSELKAVVANNVTLVPATLSMSMFVYEALLNDPVEFGQFVLKDICRKWGYMLDQEATSFWETIKGQADFDGAGSLCHGWSAVPVYIFQSHLLGVKPLTPGFKQFIVNPAMHLLDYAEGTVPTPSGDIKLHWNNSNDCKLYLQYPADLQVQVPRHLGNKIIFEKI